MIVGVVLVMGEVDVLMRGGFGGRAIDERVRLLEARILEVEHELVVLCMGESMSKDESSISSSGDSIVEALIECWKTLLMDDGGSVEVVDVGGVMVGNVCLLGLESAGAKVGRRGVCDWMLGLGPQLDTGEKKGEVGLRIFGEKVEGILEGAK